MAKHIIFVVHGVGKQDANTWSASIAKQIRDMYSAYNISKDVPFDESFEVKPISYDGGFEKIRKRWRTDSAAVLKSMKDVGVDNSALKSISQLATVPAKDDFFGAFVMDVVLYKFFPTVREAVKTSVVDQLKQSIFDAQSGDVRDWSIIAHSLGTAVTHDALHAMFTTQVKGKTLQGITKARVLMMLANVSRLLEEDGVDAYRSFCRPGSTATEGVCRQFINAIHDWDPIPRPKEFRPLDDWPTVAARQEGRFTPVRINAFQSKNIHAFSHYLANPKVHVQLFRRLFQFATPEQVIPEVELQKASALYESTTPFGAFDGLQKTIKPLLLGEAPEWADVIKKYTAFFTALEDF